MKTRIDMSGEAKKEDVGGVLRRVQELLEAGAADRAIELLSASGADPLLQNARGVCLMRLGRIREAVELFRGLALRSGSGDLDRPRPMAFATNFATSLLLDRNVRGCLDVLCELDEDEVPTAHRLREAIAACRLGLGLWERIQFSVYGVLRRPVELAFLPGELVLPVRRHRP